MKKPNDIRYAQCWEDPRTLTEALAITSEDDVLSIASGGENTFALLLKEPRSITAIDTNPAQIYLLELKMIAVKVLDYNDFVGFIGARRLDHRNYLYRLIRGKLSSVARDFWDENPNLIRKGVIHVGKFERYFKIFRRSMLPLVHGKQTVQQLLECSTIEEQRTFFRTVWNNRRWQWLYRLFFSRFVLGRLGRDPMLFKHVMIDNIAEELLKRTHKGLIQVPIRDNYFLEYILTGSYRDLRFAHPWLQERTFQKLKNSIDLIRLVNTDINRFLEHQVVNSLSKINLSDIFEYMSVDNYELTLRNLIRVNRSAGRLAFWTLFVPRDIPVSLQERLFMRQKHSKELFKRDRTFFYGSFISMDVR